MTPVFAYNWYLVWAHKSVFIHGLFVALEVAAAALVLSVVIGLLLALARMGKAPVSWLASIYVNVFRGLPALVTVIWVYFGLSELFGINFTVFQAGVIALTLLYSAFISEIYRAALHVDPSRAARGRARPRHATRVGIRTGGAAPGDEDRRSPISAACSSG